MITLEEVCGTFSLIFEDYRIDYDNFGVGQDDVWWFIVIEYGNREWIWRIRKTRYPELEDLVYHIIMTMTSPDDGIWEI